MVDVARRLCEDNQIHVSEIWSYFTVGEDVRFTLVHRSREAVLRLPPARPAPARGTGQESGGSQARRAAAQRSPLRARKAAKKPARAQKRK